jgi:hypothetical protein
MKDFSHACRFLIEHRQNLGKITERNKDLSTGE